MRLAALPGSLDLVDEALFSHRLIRQRLGRLLDLSGDSLDHRISWVEVRLLFLKLGDLLRVALDRLLGRLQVVARIRHA
jgi:hypothetical protein